MTQLQRLQLITLLLLWHKEGDLSGHEADVLYQALFRLLRELRDSLREPNSQENLDDIPF